jgi:hypothetical protein
MRNLSEDNQCPDQDSKQAYPEYKLNEVAWSVILNIHAKFEVLTAVVMSSSILWDVMSC